LYFVTKKSIFIRVAVCIGYDDTVKLYPQYMM